ncbi:MAG: M81 family metallopeptidase, partial [Rhodoferax sp.]|nr:M81 family metallopeptidase [Rhodoferax sp.]
MCRWQAAMPTDDRPAPGLPYSRRHRPPTCRRPSTMPRVLAAAFKHETNTFSPLPTDLAAYAARCLRHGADIPAYFQG